MKIKKSPPGLKKSGKKFWREVMAEFDIEKSYDLSRVRMACTCLDDIDESEKSIKSDGLFLKDRFQQIRENPASKTIRDNKLLFVKIIRELGFDIDTPGDSRQPRRY